MYKKSILRYFKIQIKLQEALWVKCWKLLILNFLDKLTLSILHNTYIHIDPSFRSRLFGIENINKALFMVL